MFTREAVSVLKDGAVAAREVVLITLLAVLLLNPPVIVGWLENSKLEKVGVFGLSIETKKAAQKSLDEGINAANEVRILRDQVQVTEENFQKLQNILDKTLVEGDTDSNSNVSTTNTSDEIRKLSQQVELVKSSIAKTREAAQRAQSGTQNAILAQTQAVQKTGGITNRGGWVWIGQIDTKTGQLRNVGEPETVVQPNTLDPAALINQRISFQLPTDMYLEPFDGASNGSAIVGVANPRITAKVIEAKLMRFGRHGLAMREADDQILWARVEFEE